VGGTGASTGHLKVIIEYAHSEYRLRRDVEADLGRLQAGIMTFALHRKTAGTLERTVSVQIRATGLGTISHRWTMKAE